MFRRLCDLTDQSHVMHAVLAVNLLKSFLSQRAATFFLLNLKTKHKKLSIITTIICGLVTGKILPSNFSCDINIKTHFLFRSFVSYRVYLREKLNSKCDKYLPSHPAKRLLWLSEFYFLDEVSRFLVPTRWRRVEAFGSSSHLSSNVARKLEPLKNRDFEV